MRYPLLLLSLLIAAPGATQDAPPDNDALAGGAPWQAQIYSNFTGWTPQELATRDPWDLAHRCGGSLIAPQWVLTAAHCIDQAKVDKGYRVRLGAVSIGGDDGATYRIDRMVRHAAYDKAHHYNDIALVHFVADDETDESNVGAVAPIALYDGDPLGADVAVTATGWGKLAGGDASFQADLSRVDVATIDCDSLPAYAGRTNDAMICAGADGQDTCQGDSGGPLVLAEGQPVQVGVVSWGEGCGDPDKPGVYVRIDRDHFLGWIRRAMAADPSVNSLGD